MLSSDNFCKTINNNKTKPALSGNGKPWVPIVSLTVRKFQAAGITAVKSTAN